MAKKRIGILISGRGSNMTALIQAAREDRLGGEVALVLSDKAEVPGLAKARELGVEARAMTPRRWRTKLDGDDAREYAAALEAAGVELVCLAGFMRVVKAPLLEAFPERILNIHPSLLPAFPGLDVQRRALEYGARYSGCTVHFVDASLDGGPIIAQRVVEVRDDDDADSLSARILEQEHRLYPEAVALVLSGRYRLEGRRVIRL